MRNNARSTLSAPWNENLDIKVVPPDDMADPGMMHVSKRETPSFAQCFSWEVDSAESTPTEAILKSASYRHHCKADETGFDETKFYLPPL